MFYDISGLCPIQEMGGYGFCIKLYPKWKDLVANTKLTQEMVDRAIDRLGRTWLDVCGFNQIYDPDNCGYAKDAKKKPGPRARPMYQPGRDLLVSWGEWGPEHITVPGNACGLDLTDSIGKPRGGRLLAPHNVDCWKQVHLLLVVFCWFAETMALDWEIHEADKRKAAKAAGGEG